MSADGNEAESEFLEVWEGGWNFRREVKDSQGPGMELDENYENLQWKTACRALKRTIPKVLEVHGKWEELGLGKRRIQYICQMNTKASFHIFEEEVPELLETGFHSDGESNNKGMNVARGVSTTVPVEACSSKKSTSHALGSCHMGDRIDSVSFFI
jgi:hypothetical protein